MSEILFQYEKINPATWVYLSSLLMIGLFFQFNRFWSVRNLDLVLLILLAPGLLMVNQAPESAGKGLVEVGAATTAAGVTNAAATDPASSEERSETLNAPADTASGVRQPTSTQPVGMSRHRIAYVGYLWLLGVSLVWLVRMLADRTVIRLPLLEPNATKGCLLFLGCSLFVFLMANVIVSDPTSDDINAVKSA